MKLEKALKKAIKLYIQHKFQIKKILLFQKKNIKDEKNLNYENMEKSSIKLQKDEICKTSRINKENNNIYDSLHYILEIIKKKLDKFKEEEKVKNKSDEECEGSNVLKILFCRYFKGKIDIIGSCYNYPYQKI